MWVSHHQMFTLIGRANSTFLLLNVIFLLPVAFVPFPTALVAQHIQEPERRTVAVLLYGAVSVLIALMFNVLWAYASARDLAAQGAHAGTDRAGGCAASGSARSSTSRRRSLHSSTRS